MLNGLTLDEVKSICDFVDAVSNNKELYFDTAIPCDEYVISVTYGNKQMKVVMNNEEDWS